MNSIIEKEVKILEIDVEEVRKKLQTLGTRHTFSGSIHDTYYDTPENSLARAGKRLRIRKKGSEHLITMKSRVKSKRTKARHEQEMFLQDYTSIIDLFASKGLEASWEKKKYRIAYTLGDMSFDIDIYNNMPALLEIEGPNAKKIYTWIKKLGLEKKTTATFGAHGLCKRYNLPATALL